MSSNNEDKRNKARDICPSECFYELFVETEGGYREAASALDVSSGALSHWMQETGLLKIINSVHSKKKQKTYFADNLSLMYTCIFLGQDIADGLNVYVKASNCPVLMLLYAMTLKDPKDEEASKPPERTPDGIKEYIAKGAKLLKYDVVEFENCLKITGWYDFLFARIFKNKKSRIYSVEETNNLVDFTLDDYERKGLNLLPIQSETVKADKAEEVKPKPEVKSIAVAAKKSIAKTVPAVVAEEVLPAEYTVTVDSLDFKDVSDLVKKASVDLSKYDVVKVQHKIVERQTLNHRSIIQLKRKYPIREMLQDLIDEIRENAPVVERKVFAFETESNKTHRRVLELGAVDWHIGSTFTLPDGSLWDSERAVTVIKNCIEKLIKRAEVFGPFEEILLPVGNDLTHVDNLQHTTTAGTPQPDCFEAKSAFNIAHTLIIDIVARLTEIAPVRLVIVPGNHDAYSNNNLGVSLAALYSKDENVTVDNTNKTYKFYPYGNCFVCLEHGRDIKPQILNQIINNEYPEASRAISKEIHFGHHHRYGTSKPAMEEQGIRVKFMPTIVPPDSWHNQHGYNWQQRGMMGFILDYDAGVISDVNVYLDRDTHEVIG